MPQNSAVGEPGVHRARARRAITALSTISITAIETVSAASATCSASAKPTPGRSTPRMVSA